jgi:hypothetical protein
MSLPFYFVNSMSYATSSSVLTINADYHRLRGGGSFSLIGFPTAITFSITNPYDVGAISTYSISLSASTTYNLTFSFLSAPYIDYPLNQPQLLGITQSSTIPGGVVTYNLGIQQGDYATKYQMNRPIFNYTFKTS